MTADVPYILCALGTSVLVIYKFRAWRAASPAGRPAILPVWVSGICVALSFLVSAPAVGETFNRVTGVPSLSILVVSVAATGYICTAQIMLWYWLRPAATASRISQWLLAGYGAVVAAMIVLFILGPRSGAHHLDFLAVYASSGTLAAFVAIHYAAYLVGISTVLVICWRWSTGASVAERPWLRRGLKITSIGLAGSVIYSLITLIAVIIGWTDQDTTIWTITIAPLFSASGVPFVLVGMSIPTWGPRLAHLPAWLSTTARDLRDLRRLRQLWTLLRPVDPAMVHRHTILDYFDVKARLFWRIIEINDWLQRLGPSAASPQPQGRHSPSLRSDRQHAAAEATAIRAAILARGHGQRGDPAATRLNPQVEPTETQYAFATDRARLLLISDSLRG
ncbi:MAB_1171c family putative transporter [Kutzneria albida]|uniref:DUF6545 domain-containing protein n=1 Tax=Kutzneria albida DSM 43870 TaxID=1449976 RepID=W5WCD2_9PSEU|nr:MAB_1171c family putative transporter [Kutzneria albida]AHH98557.1 hypothetical protein KALB_5195 [Kutzneria albida DSM 43870]